MTVAYHRQLPEHFYPVLPGRARPYGEFFAWLIDKMDRERFRRFGFSFGPPPEVFTREIETPYNAMRFRKVKGGKWVVT